MSMKNIKKNIFITIGIVLVIAAAIAIWVNSQVPYVAERGLALSRFMECDSQSSDTQRTCYMKLVPDEATYQSCINGFEDQEKALIMKLISLFNGVGKLPAVYSDCQLALALTANDVRVCERKDNESNLLCVIRYANRTENAVLLRDCPTLSTPQLRGRCFGAMLKTTRTLSQEEINTLCGSATNVVWSFEETKVRFDEICASTTQ